LKASGPEPGEVTPRSSHHARQPLRLAPATTEEGRLALEEFIRKRFAERYGANVRHFMPRLFGLESPDGALHAAVGCRSASEQPLFLERYLADGIEHAIRERCATRVSRPEIVEVGNLATRRPATARLLIVELAWVLSAQGFRWVAFTATPSLLNSFVRLGLTPTLIGPADPARLGDERCDWGSYYDSRPQIVVGEILQGCRPHRRGTDPLAIAPDAQAMAPPSQRADCVLRSAIADPSHAASL